MVETSKSKMVIDTYNAHEDEICLLHVLTSQHSVTDILPPLANKFQKAFWFKMIRESDRQFAFKINNEWYE